MGNRDVLGVLGCRPIPYRTRKEKEKEEFKLGHYQKSPQLTTNRDKTRKLVLSTAKWSVLSH
jgi:hypothetical protein